MKFLEDSRLVQIRGKETAKDMLNVLKSLYLNGNGQYRINFLKELALTRMDEFQSLDFYVLIMQNLYTCLVSCVEEISHQMQIAFYLTSLPEHSSAFSGSYQGDGKTLSDLIPCLLAEDMCQQNNRDANRPTAYMANKEQ